MRGASGCVGSPAASLPSHHRIDEEQRHQRGEVDDRREEELARVDEVLLPREADRRDDVARAEQERADVLALRASQGELVVFLGSGVSVGAGPQVRQNLAMTLAIKGDTEEAKAYGIVDEVLQHTKNAGG